MNLSLKRFGACFCFHAVVFAFIVCLSCVSGFGGEHPEVELAAEFENGLAVDSGMIRTVVLSGNFRQMGRQYGALLDCSLTNAYQAVFTDHLFAGKITTFEKARDFSRYIWDYYPARLKEFTAGAAETSSLGMDELIMLDQYLWFVMVKDMDDSGVSSVVASFDEYAGGRSMNAGRSEDYAFFPEPARYMPVVTVFNPDTGDIPVLTVGFPGQIQSVAAMNSKGLIVMQNNAALSGDRRRIFDRINNMIQTPVWLFNADSLQYIEVEVNSFKPSHASVILAASPAEAVVYEVTTSETRKRIGANRGLVTAANHFANPVWDMPEVCAPLERSLERQNNLLMLAEQFKGKLNAEGMMALLDKPASDRGVLGEHTRLQLVFSVPDRTVWLKIPALQGWTRINAGEFFK